MDSKLAHRVLSYFYLLFSTVMKNLKKKKTDKHRFLRCDCVLQVNSALVSKIAVPEKVLAVVLDI